MKITVKKRDDVARLIGLMALAFILSGCDEIRSGLMSRADKVNQAYPVPDNLLVARGMLSAALQGDANSKTIRDQYAQLLERRAAECSGGVGLGRFDTSEQVRRKIGADKSCFAAYDLKLVHWVGTSRVALELRKPPLVPWTPLSARTVLPPDSDWLSFAKDANVVVTWGPGGKLRAMELPSGRVINTFQAPHPDHDAGTLSPNGRVLALSQPPNNLVMMDVDSGRTLWSTSDYSGVVAWLPEVAATLLVQKSSGATALLDHQSAGVTPYLSPMPYPGWSLPVPDRSGRIVIGNYGTVAVMDHVRRPDGGIEAVKANQFELATGTSTPFLMSK
jgi:hypothetical protein